MSEIAPPIELRDNTGRVFAYACPRCLNVHTPAPDGGPDENERQYRADRSLEAAVKCCLCRDCGAPLTRQWPNQCGACEVRERALWERARERAKELL